MIKLNSNQYIIFNLKVKYASGNYASLSTLQKVNNSDHDNS